MKDGIVIVVEPDYLGAEKFNEMIFGETGHTDMVSLRRGLNEEKSDDFYISDEETRDLFKSYRDYCKEIEAVLVKWLRLSSVSIVQGEVKLRKRTTKQGDPHEIILRRDAIVDCGDYFIQYYRASLK